MTHCLNCNQHLSTPYCANCGQKASTHRYSLKHFIEHDLVHGILHVDKGILFTVKALFTRPGHAIRAFIEGKRVGYFNYITLIIIVIGIAHFLGSFSPMKLADLYPESSRAAMSAVEDLSAKYPKLVPLFTIPLFSLFSYLWFRKARMNGTEHLVMNAYKAAAEMILAMPFALLMIVYHDKQVLFIVYGIFSGLLTTAYHVWFYYQYFSAFGYRKWSLLLRSIMVPVSVALFMMIIGIATGIILALKK